jgi:hypothetical protein
VWDVADKDEIDPDRACFVRCSTTAPYKNDSQAAAPGAGPSAYFDQVPTNYAPI